MRPARLVSWLNMRAAMRRTAGRRSSTTQPTTLHQRVPLYIGNRTLVEKVEAQIRDRMACSG